MQKWEYCWITYVQRDHYDPATLHIFLDNRDYEIELEEKGIKLGNRSEKKELLQRFLPSFKYPDRGMNKADFFSYFLNALGNAGWELTGCGNDAEKSHTLYFKRTKIFE